MTFDIIFSPNAQKQFDRLEKTIQERISSSLDRIKMRPYDSVKRLSGYPYYRMRVGDYRLILDVIENKLIIIIIEVGHRRNIYK